MAGTVDGQETQLGVLPLGGVARGLLGHRVRLPGLAGDLVAQAPDPGLGADGTADGIVITRVDEHVQAEFAVNEVVVDGRGGDLTVGGVVLELVRAGLPLGGGLHVDGLLHGELVEVGGGVVVRAGLVSLGGEHTHAQAVRVRHLVEHVVQQPGALGAAHLGRGVGDTHRVVDRVGVQVAHQGVQLHLKLNAGSHVRLGGLDALLLVLVVRGLGEQLVAPVSVVHGRGATVHIGVRIAHGETLEVDDGVAGGGGNGVLVHDLLGEGGDIVTTVRFGCDVQLVGLVLGEASQESLDQVIVILGGLCVTGGVVSLVVTVRKSDAGRGLDVDNVTDGVPRVLVKGQG